jgi:hypothetical protein
MIASPASVPLGGVRWLVAAALAFTAVCGPSAHARESGAPEFAARISQLEEPSAPVETDVRVDRLSTVGADSAGVLTAAQGGFGANMWHGTRRSLVETLLPRLPVDTGSRVMRDLMRRLLLSAAGAPEGESVPGTLAALRARMLLAMGDLDGVERLLEAASVRAANPDLARIRTDALLLANDNAAACTIAEGQVNETSAVYWQKALIFCQALAGEHDKAALGVALLGEMGEVDPAFFALVAALAGEPATIDSLPDPTPLHLAMARAAKVELPADVASSDQLAVLHAVAVSPNASAETRLEAADRTQAAGALPADTLRQLYAGMTFEPPAAGGLNPAAAAENGALARARAYRAAVAAETPGARTEAIARALETARKQGRYVATALVYLPLLEDIPPLPENMGLASEALAALLVAGKQETAENWYASLTATAKVDPQADAALLEAMPMAHLAWAANAEGWHTGDLSGWWQSIRDAAGARDRATRVYTLLEATGTQVPGPLWAPLLDDTGWVTGTMPPAALLNRLSDAAVAGRTGETVLLALLALGEETPSATDATTLGQVVRSLGAIGLDDEGRALALEIVAATQ